MMLFIISSCQNLNSNGSDDISKYIVSMRSQPADEAVKFKSSILSLPAQAAISPRTARLRVASRGNVARVTDRSLTPPTYMHMLHRALVVLYLSGIQILTDDLFFSLISQQ